ncbi:hypothetical protein [Nocardia sp. NPDC057668]|uniref:hypothetical protein n=1 Tax=Nocardia sp. NPDC057668 TaxID=3346202 RepID=UPI00366E3432
MSSSPVPAELRINHAPPEEYVRQRVTNTLILSVFCAVVVGGLYFLLNLRYWALLGLVPMLLVVPFGVIGFVRNVTRAPMYRATVSELVMSRRWRRDWSQIEWMSIGGKYGAEFRVGLRDGRTSRGFALTGGYDVQWWEFFDYIGKVAPHVRFIDRRDHDRAWRQRTSSSAAPERPSRPAERIAQFLASAGGLAAIIAGLLFFVWNSADPDRAMCDEREMSPGDRCVSSTGKTTTYADELATSSRQRDGAPTALAVALGGVVVSIGSFTALVIMGRGDWQDEDPALPPVTTYRAVDRG